MNPIVAADVATIADQPVIAQPAHAFDHTTIVIAGAGGLIARYTALALVELCERGRLEATVVCLARDLAAAEAAFAGCRGRRHLRLVQQTLGEPLRYSGEADVIVHAGGASGPHHYRRDPYGVAAANVRAGFDLIDLARQRGTRRLVYFSSRELYGHSAPDAAGRLSETALGLFDHLQPRNSYPEGKRMTESLFAVAAEQFGIGYQLLRLASVYGPGMKLTDDGRAMADLIGARLAGQPLRLAGDGRVRRGYCYAADAVAGLLTILFAGQDNQVYNIANDTAPVAVREVAELVAGVDVPGLPPCEVMLGSQPSPAGYSDFGYLPVATEKLEALGWRPVIDLPTGVRRTLESFRATG